MSDVFILPQPRPFAIPATYGTSGVPGPTGPAGASYASRTLMAARPSPTVGDRVSLYESGRDGEFFVGLASAWTAQIAADTYQGIFVLSTVDATKVFIRTEAFVKGQIWAQWFGVVDGASNNAARVESIETIFYPRAAHIFFSAGEISFDRGMIFTRPHRIEGQGQGTDDTIAQPNGVGPTVLLFPFSAGAAFRIKHGPGGVSAGSSGAQRASISHLRIEFEGSLPSNGTCNFATSSPQSLTSVSPTGNFANGQVVVVEGAGPSLLVQDRTIALTSGNNVATVTNAVFDEFGSLLPGNPGVYVGQKIVITGAGVAGADLTGFVGAWGSSSITIVNAAGAALNASTTVSAATYTIYYPIVTEIQSGGGTATLTTSVVPNVVNTVTGAALRHANVGVYATCTVDMTNVEVNAQGSGGSSSAGGGIGLFLAGITSDTSIADNCFINNCKFTGSLTFAGLVLQGNDAQVNTFINCNFAGPKIGVLDMGLLGNDFFGCHWAFNVGAVVVFLSAFTKFIGGYFETGTSWNAPYSSQAFFIGTLGLHNGFGLNGLDYSAGGIAQLGPAYINGARFRNGVWQHGGQPSYFTGNMNFTPAGIGTNSGVMLGNSNGGSGGTNMLSSFDNASSATTRALAAEAASFSFGNSGLGAQFGTWDTSGGIRWRYPLGYDNGGNGVGGTVTQATSKSAGVTLNKATGQITLNNAALASVTVVSFTLTNSQIAAADHVDVILKSGNATAGTYRVWAESPAAGSCIVCVENRSAGSLSEALVLNFNVQKGGNS